MKKMRSRRNSPKYETEGPFFNPQPGHRSTKNAQAGPFFSPAAIQRKLTVGAANSPAETEADQMAGQVVQRLEQPDALQRAVNEEKEKEKVQRQPLEEKDKLQKQAAPEEEEKVQTKPAGNSPAPATVAHSLQSSKGGGRPLPAALRSGAEQALGADFGSVRVHTDAESARMNEALHAQAFTHGHDLYFNEGKYRPETAEGKRLLGHELGHVVQNQQNQRRILLKEEKKTDLESLRKWYSPSIEIIDNQEMAEFEKRSPDTSLVIIPDIRRSFESTGYPGEVKFNSIEVSVPKGTAFGKDFKTQMIFIACTGSFVYFKKYIYPLNKQVIFEVPNSREWGNSFNKLLVNLTGVDKSVRETIISIIETSAPKGDK